MNAGESVLRLKGGRTVGVRRCARACASEGRNDLVKDSGFRVKGSGFRV